MDSHVWLAKRLCVPHRSGVHVLVGALGEGKLRAFLGQGCRIPTTRPDSGRDIHKKGGGNDNRLY
eukprot:1157559-Pelagomonas_calceolata.AAC.1